MKREGTARLKSGLSLQGGIGAPPQLQLRVRSVDWSVSAFMELTLGSSFRPGVARLAARIAPEVCIFFARFGLRKR